jgi:hypothetical protein
MREKEVQWKEFVEPRLEFSKQGQMEDLVISRLLMLEFLRTRNQVIMTMNSTKMAIGSIPVSQK